MTTVDIIIVNMGAVALLPMEPKYVVPEEELSLPEYAPRRTPWLLGGILLMGLDS
ncbi:hypothetical protein DSO57_1021087 [Entomophthora muscae]|uniref:Uncharacterized protein n=1 Tax=Entomophthora muscae TaxID=34485 RepID=A0ACC2TEA0_9FUNG|nr:hypothetical protein DSO57_1021087 [Entomophthora muscae]